MTSGLGLVDVCKTYPNGMDVIHGINLDVGGGEFVVIVGPSGCGKSTLLRMVAGLETVTTGEIKIGANRVNELEPSERNIAMVFQNYALYPHMNVFNNLAYGLRNGRVAKSEIAKRVTATAEKLQLDGLLERKPAQLSGGQRQRVAMGRAIVRKPEVFLFDEPLSNLDAKLRVQMRLEIVRLQRSLGTTSLYVTHDQVEAMTLANRLIVMNAGEAEQIGTPLEIYDKPANKFVAGFIGSPAMNFMSASWVNQGQLIAIDGSNKTISIHSYGGSGDEQILVGIRPEHWQITSEDSSTVNMVVEFVELLGSEVLVHGVFNQGTNLTVRVLDRRNIAPGDSLGLHVEPNNIHLFDSLNGKRLNHSSQ